MTHENDKNNNKGLAGGAHGNHVSLPSSIILGLGDHAHTLFDPPNLWVMLCD